MAGLVEPELSQRIVALERAIAIGVQEVAEKDRRTQYKSTRQQMAELDYLRRCQNGTLTALPEDRRYRTRAIYNKGVP